MDIAKIDAALKVLQESLAGVISAEKAAAIKAMLSTPDNEKDFLLIQEGGSSRELYVHAHFSEEDAKNDRFQCEVDGSYRTSEVLQVPRWLCNVPGFFDVAEQLIKLSQEVDHPFVPADWEEKTGYVQSEVGL